MAKIHLMGAALVAATVVAGCCDKKNCATETPAAETPAAEEAAKDPNEVVLAVCGQELKRGELDATVAKMLAARGEVPADQLPFVKEQMANQIAQQFLVETILLDKAAKSGYAFEDADLKAREAEFLKAVAGKDDAPKSLEEAMAKHPLGKERAQKDMKNGVIIDKMLKAEIIDKDTTDYAPRAKEIIDGIVANNEKCLDDAGALAKINDLKKTLDATADADKAAKFAELAKAESACPSGKNAGGDLGEFTHGQMVKEFDEAAFSAEIGKIVGPVKTQFGYHLIMTTKKTPAVAATDDKPGEPEKVQASHILIKVGEKQEVPEAEQVINYLKTQANRQKVNQFIMENVMNAEIKASDDFKQFVPPPKKPAEEPKAEAKDAAETAEKAVETPAEK